VVPIGGWAFWLSTALLAVASVAATLLALRHFGGHLPGCGPQSGCESLEATAWGKVPGIGWPVSFLGFAYFSALLAGWIVSAGRLPRRALWLLRAGCAASFGFLVLMIFLRKLCPYCATIHVANLGFLSIVERSRLHARPALSSDRSSGSAGKMIPNRGMGRIATAAALTFVVVTAVLAAANGRYEKDRLAKAESDRLHSSQKIVEKSQEPDSNRLIDMWGSTGFTGRYRLGPDVAPIRIVMLTDYQCPDCKRVEGEVVQILAARKDVSLSIKHFPMCMEASKGVPCNKYAKQTMHPNACWAARAAEAAGILKGNDGFWQMHRWLFEKSGLFDGQVLNAALTQFGYDPNAFWAVMNSPETLSRVQSDVEEGAALGLFYTPMIFVNGVEFKGWQVPGALTKTIDEVAAKNPPPMKATADRPPIGDQKYIDDWKEQTLRPMPPDTRSWSIGAPPSAKTGVVDVVLFGDYQEPYCASMDSAIRDFVKGHSQVRYTFRHYPIDPAANPALPEKVRPEAIHPLAGRAAEAAEAAGSLGGSAAYWKMHAWLMANQKAFSDDAVRAAAGKMGLDGAALLAAMDKPDVSAAIAEDARAAQRVGLTGVPMVFINSRWVPRTTRDDENIVIRILTDLTNAGKTSSR
jgi:protein-disulfide isomerase/uncharacterized membrane protein